MEPTTNNIRHIFSDTRTPLRAFTSYLHPDEVIALTSACKLTRNDCTRADAIAKITTHQEIRVRASMERDLPKTIERIYTEMKAHGPVPVISYPFGMAFAPQMIIQIGSEIRSSLAIVQSKKTGLRGIIILFEGFSAFSIRKPGSSWNYRPDITIPIQSIVSAIFLVENIYRGSRQWRMVIDPEVELLEESFAQKKIPRESRLTDAILGIIAGTYPSLRLSSPTRYNTRHAMITITTRYHIPEGCSLIVRGNGIGMDHWQKSFPMISLGTEPYTRHHAYVRVSIGSEYKIFLKSLTGKLIAEDGPNRKILNLSEYEEVHPPTFSLFYR